MTEWERVAPNEIGIGDRINVGGDTADVTGILGDGSTREFAVAIHTSPPNGPDKIVTGKILAPGRSRSEGGQGLCLDHG